MNNDWLSEKITYISALKNPSDAQKLLLELAKIQYRTPDQEKKLNALIKADVISFLVSLLILLELGLYEISPTHKPPIIETNKKIDKDPNAGGLFSTHLIADMNSQKGIPHINPIKKISFNLLFIFSPISKLFIDFTLI